MKVSPEYKQRVMRAVEPELKKHRQALSPFGTLKWMVAIAGVCTIILVSTNLNLLKSISDVGPLTAQNIEQSYDQDLFSQEFAQLSDEDLDMLENLDLLEDSELLEALGELTDEEVI